MADFKKLLVWQKAHALAVLVSDRSGRLRAPAYTSLKSQMTRAAMSIAANIAEGRGQAGARGFARHLDIAIGSAYELEFHLLIARDTRALPGADRLMMLEQLIEVRRMLYGLVKHVRATL